MSDVFTFVVKILLFSFSYYLLLEFLSVCKVKTEIGIGVVLFTVVAITVLFYAFNRHLTSTCSVCGKKEIK